MTAEDDSRLTEEEMDEIADRVVRRMTGGATTETETEDAEDGVTVEVVTSDEEETADDGADATTPDVVESLRAALEQTDDGALQSVQTGLERAIEALEGTNGQTEGVVVGPGDTGGKAVYKTQLQKGGRVAVPDAEVETLGVEPGDTLQVIVFPVED